MTEPPDWITLTDDETVVWAGRPSGYPYAVGSVNSIVVIALGIAVWLIARGSLVVDPRLSGLPETIGTTGGGLLVVLGAYGVVRAALNWWSRYYVITTEEVYRKRGLVSRTVTNLRLERVQDTTFTQSALGRALSYGDVHVQTASGGGPEVTFDGVADPEAVTGEITRQLDRRRAGRG